MINRPNLDMATSKSVRDLLLKWEFWIARARTNYTKAIENNEVHSGVVHICLDCEGTIAAIDLNQEVNLIEMLADYIIEQGEIAEELRLEEKERGIKLYEDRLH